MKKGDLFTTSDRPDLSFVFDFESGGYVYGYQLLNDGNVGKMIRKLPAESVIQKPQ